MRIILAPANVLDTTLARLIEEDSSIHHELTAAGAMQFDVATEPSSILLDWLASEHRTVLATIEPTTGKHLAQPDRLRSTSTAGQLRDFVKKVRKVQGLRTNAQGKIPLEMLRMVASAYGQFDETFIAEMHAFTEVLWQIADDPSIAEDWQVVRHD